MVTLITLVALATLVTLVTLVNQVSLINLAALILITLFKPCYTLLHHCLFHAVAPPFQPVRAPLDTLLRPITNYYTPE